MAVVQISRIQVRRGQSQQGSGIPQLASGELGWAVDTRELYIGNGAVSEGAPAVGNTQLLTQYDNLFSVADTYIYKDGVTVATGGSASSSVQRPLQASRRLRAMDARDIATARQEAHCQQSPVATQR